MFIIGTRRQNTGRAIAPGNGPHLIFYSLPDYNELHSEKLDFAQLKGVGNRFEVRPAGRGIFFAVLNKEVLLRINTSDFTFEDVTGALVAHPKGGGEIKEIEPLSGSQQALFEVQSTAGKRFFYDPLANAVYASLEELSLPANTGGTGDSTFGFAFTPGSSRYPNKPVVLVRYATAARQNSIAPQPRFNWRPSPGASAFGEETEPVLAATGAVRSFEDFTPGGTYNNARVLFWDVDLVLFIATEGEDAKATQILQALDAQTGTGRFKLPLPQAGYPTAVVRYQEGFLVKDVAYVFMVSKAGTLTKVIRIQ